MVVTKRGGTRFLSLRDWPVKRDGNVLRSMSIEDYLAMKFRQVEEQLHGMEQRLEAMAGTLKRLEEANGKFDERLRWLETGAAARSEAQTPPRSAPVPP